jgi:hypothetical protein
MPGDVHIVLLAHVAVLGVTLLLLAVPSWRRRFLSWYWSPLVLLLAAFGAIYGALIYWPDALGGQSVGVPIAYGVIGLVVVLGLASFIRR